MKPNVRPDAGDPAALGGSAEPVAPPPDDSSTANRLALIAGGSALTLEQAVHEFLGVADEVMQSSTGKERPPEAHGGAYLSRWRFARLRNALEAALVRAPQGDAASEIADVTAGLAAVLDDWKLGEAPSEELARRIVALLCGAASSSGSATALTAGIAQHLARTHLYVGYTDSLNTPIIRGWDALATALDTVGGAK